MRGRIVATIPALNEFGVAYRDLLAAHREASARQLAAYRAALRAWLAADRVNATSKARRILTELARQKTDKALS